jgi:hypothetical protein
MFEGNPCEYFQAAAHTELCDLLSERNIADICRKGRCTYVMIEVSQKKMSRQLSLLDEREDLDLEKIFGRLERYCLDRTLNIDQWFGLVGLKFRAATIEIARRRGLISPVDNCGTCSYLSISKPLRCLISGESRAKGDQVCEDYLPVRVVFKQVTDERQIEAFTEKESILKAADNERQDVDRLFVENIEFELRNRALKERQNSQKRAIYTRQYNLFVGLRHALKTIDSVAEALEILARQLDVSVRAIRRDIQEIRNFLRQKGV